MIVVVVVVGGFLGLRVGFFNIGFITSKRAVLSSAHRSSCITGTWLRLKKIHNYFRVKVC